MGDKAWKGFERDSAAVFDGGRFWANAGERIDFAGRLCGRLPVRGQCKLVQALSLEKLTQLAEEMEGQPGTLGVVCVKVRRGTGRESAPLVVMTFEEFEKLKALIPMSTNIVPTNWAGS